MLAGPCQGGRHREKFPLSIPSLYLAGAAQVGCLLMDCDQGNGVDQRGVGSISLIIQEREAMDPCAQLGRGKWGMDAG